MAQLVVRSEKCIACGKCYLHYPNVFDCNDEGIAFVIKEADAASQEQANLACYECPTRAIEVLDEDQDESLSVL